MPVALQVIEHVLAAGMLAILALIGWLEWRGRVEAYKADLELAKRKREGAV